MVHWAGEPQSSDPFLSGVYWALAWSVDQVFGEVLGGLLNEATVSNVERWNGSYWQPVA